MLKKYTTVSMNSYKN